MKKLIIAAIACAFTSAAFAQGAAPAPAAPAAPKAAPAAEKNAAPGKKNAGPAKLPLRRKPGKTTIKNAPKS